MLRFRLPLSLCGGSALISVGQTTPRLTDIVPPPRFLRDSHTSPRTRPYTISPWSSRVYLSPSYPLICVTQSFRGTTVASDRHVFQISLSSLHLVRKLYQHDKINHIPPLFFTNRSTTQHKSPNARPPPPPPTLIEFQGFALAKRPSYPWPTPLRVPPPPFLHQVFERSWLPGHLHPKSYT